MRSVRYSLTAREQLRELLAWGVPRFGPDVVARKRDQLLRFIETDLAQLPAMKRPHEGLGLIVYPVTNTPFIVLYDYDEHDLRVHFILRAGAGDRLDDLDPSSAEW